MAVGMRPISFGLWTAVPQLNSPIELKSPYVPLYVMLSPSAEVTAEENGLFKVPGDCETQMNIFIKNFNIVPRHSQMSVRFK